MRLFAFHIALIPLGNGMNPIILPPAMSKIVGQTGLFSLSMATSLREGNSEIKPVKLHIKKRDLVLHLAHVEGLVHTHTHTTVKNSFNDSTEITECISTKFETNLPTEKNKRKKKTKKSC